MSLNVAVLADNLGDCVEELERILADLKKGGVDDQELQISLAHAYHHLNYAWNARHAAPGDDLSERFLELSRYPADLEPFGST